MYKKALIGLFASLFAMVMTIMSSNTYADDDSLSIIPQGDTETIENAIKEISSSGGHVVDTYNQQAAQLSCKNQIASGIRDRGTILCYISMFISFLSQIGIAIGSLMIVYAGYIYATAVFTGNNPSKGKEAVSRAILGVVIIVFAYVIIRILSRAFLQ